MLSTLIDNKNEKKNRVVAAAEKLIKITGIENISIEDVANEMGISNSTIYEFFCSKEQLIEAIIEKKIDDKKKLLQRVRMNAGNSIEQVFLGWNAVSDFFQSMNNETLNKLKRYYTQSFRLVNEFKNVFLYNYFKLNIDTGITQDVYRQNIKTDLLSHYLIEILSAPFQRSRFGAAETEDQLLSYHLYGIATEKGIRLVRKYKNEFLAYTSPFQ